MRAAGANRIPATAPGAHHRAGPGQRQVPRPAQARLHGPGPRSRDASATFPHYVGGAPPKLLTGGLKRAVFHTDHGSACTSKALATVCRKPGATSAHGSRRHQRRGRTGRVDGCHPEARDPHEHTLPDRRAHPPPLLLRPPTPNHLRATDLNHYAGNRRVNQPPCPTTRDKARGPHRGEVAVNGRSHSWPPARL